MTEPDIIPTNGSRVQSLINIFENHANMQPRNEIAKRPSCPASPPPGEDGEVDNGWCVYELSHYKDKVSI